MRIVRLCGESTILWLVVFTAIINAQTAPDRITGEINSGSVASLSGSQSPRATAQNDTGPVSASGRLNGMTIYFKPSATQKAELDALVKAQHTPGSSYYHRWLTPGEYASRFGLSSEDLAKVQTWLEQQGFSVDRVARSRTSLTFSGTVGQAESAFHTELHRYTTGGETHFANSTQVAIPSALSEVVQSVRNLDDFRPKPLVRFHREKATAAKPAYTSSQSGSHYLQPGDVAVIYDVNAAYSAGYTGTGQSIAVVGQSAVDVSDIENFQNAAGLTVKDPTLVLVPNSGSAAHSSGDEAESDLDLEYTGAIGKGATVYFVYVGNNSNYSVWDSVQYAVDTNIAPIISISYGACEPDLNSSDFTTLEAIMEQGASQGQSIIVASGDDGSTACYVDVTSSTTTVTSQEKALAVSYPASSAYVTAVGGTEFSSDDVSSSNTTYWESASGSDVVTSAKSYIPEQVWNDDSASTASQSGAEYALSSGGGGTSILTSRPSWQSGVTGIPSGNYRLVPDISLASSPSYPGYLYCSSDSTATGITGSCSNGFRDSNSQYLTVAGGTSFAAPIFAGMLAIINQKENSTGQGLINSTLYTMAANSSTYASAFHDVTSGGNECFAGSTYCSSAGEASYHATTGYDEASGLGSVDFHNLMTSWTAGSLSSLLDATVTALSAASSTPSAGANDAITITVSPQASTIAITPTGALTVAVDGTTETSSLALSNGSATYTFSSSTGGAHVITAKYSGDSTFAASIGTVTVNVGGTGGTSSSGTFSLSATNVAVSHGSSGTSTITITSKNSYAGTVGFTLSTSSSSLSTYGCYEVNDVSVAANGTATTTLTLHTSSTSCSSTSSSKTGSHRMFVYSGTKAAIPLSDRPLSRGAAPIGAAVLGGLLWGCIRRHRSLLWTMLGCLLLVAALPLLTACGGNSSSSNSVAKGSYTVELDGTDTSNSSIADSTTFTLTVN
jgi:subtilase family serine protease